MEKFELYRSGMEDKGLRVNMDKTKILVCRAKPVQSGKPSGKWPCGVCGKGVGRNSILFFLFLNTFILCHNTT